MQYHLRTLLLATGMLAVWFALIEFDPAIAIFFLGTMIMYGLVFPVAVLGIGLVAAPQKESYLDVASLRHFAVLFLIWKWCVVMSALFFGVERLRFGVFL
jgi:hypothetical protein